MTPVLNTQRLRLSPFKQSDAADVFDYASNPNVSRYCTFDTATTVADSESYIQRVLKRGDNEFCWAIRVINKPVVIGAIELGFKDDVEADIHFVLTEEHWHHGLMTEAARAVLRWAFTTHASLQRVTTAAMSKNIGSTRVMEKCGMRFRKHVKDRWKKYAEPVELSIYSMARSEWAG